MILSADARLDIEASFLAYCAAIDRRADAGEAAGYYCTDGVMDNTSLDNPLVEGRAALIATITAMFRSMARLEHYISNFLVTGHDGNTAQAQCYVQAYGQPVGGDAFAMRGLYRIETRQVGGQWKIARLTFQLFA